MMTDVKQHPIQAVQGQLFGRSQSHANTWIHVRHPVLNQALADQERLPGRTAAELAAMFATGGGAAPPLVGMMARRDRSTAPPIPRTSRTTTAASRRAT